MSTQASSHRNMIQHFIRAFSPAPSDKTLKELLKTANESEKALIQRAWDVAQVQDSLRSLHVLKAHKWAFSSDHIDETAKRAAQKIRWFGRTVMTPREIEKTLQSVPGIVYEAHKSSTHKMIDALRRLDGPVTEENLRAKVADIHAHFKAVGYFPKKQRELTKLYFHVAQDKAIGHFMDILKQADASSYGVKDINRMKGRVLAHVRSKKSGASKIRAEMQAACRGACARCCESRLNRLARAPFMNKLSPEEMAKEEKEIRKLNVRAGEESTIMDIDDRIRKAHAEGIRRFVASANPAELSPEDHNALSHRAALTGKKIILFGAPPTTPSRSATTNQMAAGQGFLIQQQG